MKVVHKRVIDKSEAWVMCKPTEVILESELTDEQYKEWTKTTRWKWNDVSCPVCLELRVN